MEKPVFYDLCIVESCRSWFVSPCLEDCLGDFYFSVSMVIMWLCGDTFKTGYFVVREAPKQFWICGALQICVDLAILGQVVFYSIKPSSASHPTIHKQ